MLSATISLLLIASVAYGQKYCCFPDKWEGLEAIIAGSADDEGHAAVTQANIKISMDATMEAVSIDEKIEQAGQPDKIYRILQLYKQNAQYIINQGKCIRTIVGTWGPDSHCIPDNATMLRQYYHGNQNKLHVTVYEFNVEQQTTEVAVTDDCIPVTELLFGNIAGTNLMSVTGIFNITTGIKDPSVFNVPDICKHAPLTSDTAGHPMFGKRRSLFSPVL